MLKHTYSKHNTQKPVLNDVWQTVRVPRKVMWHKVEQVVCQSKDQLLFMFFSSSLHVKVSLSKILNPS